MIETRRARVEDITAFSLQANQLVSELYRFKPGYAERLLAAGEGVTMIWEGRVVGVAGLARIDAELAQGWLLIADELPGSCWTQIVRGIRQFLDDRSTVFPVIQATAAADWYQGHRFCMLLGFRCMGVRPRTPNMPAQALYYRWHGDTGLDAGVDRAVLDFETVILDAAAAPKRRAA